LGNLLLQISAIWIEKYRDQLSKGNGPLVSWYDASRSGDICGWHTCQIKKWRRSCASI
jgi:hypothetical protein